MSGRIRDVDVTYVRDHSPIDDVVGEYVQLKGAGGGQKKGLCPFHDGSQARTIRTTTSGSKALNSSWLLPRLFILNLVENLKSSLKLLVE